MVPNNPELMRAAEIIQAMAAEAGFDIKIEATEFATSLDRAAKGDFEAYLIGWSGRTDPDGNIYNFVACEAPPALNIAALLQPGGRSRLEAARTTGDRPERLAHYAKVAEQVLADRPIIYLWHPKLLYAMSRQARRVHPLPRRADPAAGVADRLETFAGVKLL